MQNGGRSHERGAERQRASYRQSGHDRGAHRVDRLVEQPCRAFAGVARQSADRPSAHAHVAVRDVDGLGGRPHVLLQRRLRKPDARRQVPVGARPHRPGSMGRDLGRHRALDRARAPDRAGDVVRGTAPVPRAKRLFRGDLPHVLVQPGARRCAGRDWRPLLRRHRGDRACHQREAHRLARQLRVSPQQDADVTRGVRPLSAPARTSRRRSGGSARSRAIRTRSRPAPKAGALVSSWRTTTRTCSTT